MDEENSTLENVGDAAFCGLVFFIFLRNPVFIAIIFMYVIGYGYYWDSSTMHVPAYEDFFIDSGYIYVLWHLVVICGLCVIPIIFGAWLFWFRPIVSHALFWCIFAPIYIDVYDCDFGEMSVDFYGFMRIGDWKWIVVLVVLLLIARLIIAPIFGSFIGQFWIRDEEDEEDEEEYEEEEAEEEVDDYDNDENKKDYEDDFGKILT